MFVTKLYKMLSFFQRKTRPEKPSANNFERSYVCHIVITTPIHSKTGMLYNLNQKHWNIFIGRKIRIFSFGSPKNNIPITKKDSVRPVFNNTAEKHLKTS